MSFHFNLKSILVQRQKSIFSATLVLAITFLISALLGFLRTRFLYSAFFKCCVLELDAYNAAFRIPDLIFKLLVTGALSASFIPVFSSLLHKSKKEAYLTASAVINLLLVVFTIISIFAFIFATPLSRIIAKGFSVEQIKLMANLTRILLLAQIFFLISNFLTAILQVKQNFLLPALSPIIYNLTIIISIFTLAPLFGIHGVVYGAVIGAFFHMAIQFPAIFKSGFVYSPVLSLKLQGVKDIIRLMIPRTLSLGLSEIENTVTLFFASGLPAGSLSLLNLALQLIYLPSRIFGTTVGQASLPVLSKNVAKNQLNLFRQTVRKAILQGLYLTIPIAAITLIDRLAIVRIAFGSKQFPWSATLLTARTLAFLTPVIICQVVIQILIRSFYALHDTKTPFKISALSLSINVTLSYLLLRFTDLGIVALAVAASSANLIQALILFICFLKRVNGHDWHGSYINLLKIILATGVGSFFAWIVIRILDLFVFDTSRTISVIIIFTISVLFGLSTFVLTTSLLHSPEYEHFKSYFKRLLRFFS